jgi:DNA repair exonuclease SbcCD nuclease subunit
MPTSSRDAWGRIVNIAIREGFDAVLIAGDLVKSSPAYCEAMGPLIDGFVSLKDVGIEVFAVAGNHDASAFEKM